MGAKDFFVRYAGSVIIVLLLLLGFGLMLSLNVGGFVFGLGCWVVAYTVWLLQRAVNALEDVTNLQVQSIRKQRSRTPEREDPRPTPAPVSH
jgi:hypothetical protein